MAAVAATQDRKRQRYRRWLKTHHRVHLRYTDGVVHLIVKKRTGLIYRNLIGGMTMWQEDAEGYIIPIGPPSGLFSHRSTTTP